MVARTMADLEREAAELSMTLDRRSRRLGTEVVTALKGRVDELLLAAATLRYETEKHDSGDGPRGGSRGL